MTYGIVHTCGAVRDFLQYDLGEPDTKFEGLVRQFCGAKHDFVDFRPALVSVASAAP